MVYPILVQRLGGEGEALVLRAVAEHQMLERSIQDMLMLRNNPGEVLITRIKQAQTEVLTHQAEEEGHLLPRIMQVCTEEELSLLALAFKSAKQSAPLMPQTPELRASRGGCRSLLVRRPCC